MEPLRWIAENGGEQGYVVTPRWPELKPGKGYNAATSEYGDLIGAGVIDPVKVTRSALANAASIASLLLTTETLVVEKPEEEEDRRGRARALSLKRRSGDEQRQEEGLSLWREAFDFRLCLGYSEHPASMGRTRCTWGACHTQPQHPTPVGRTRCTWGACHAQLRYPTQRGMYPLNLGFAASFDIPRTWDVPADPGVHAMHSFDSPTQRGTAPFWYRLLDRIGSLRNTRRAPDPGSSRAHARAGRSAR